MNKWEEILNQFEYVAGVDEVGRGCFAGPVVACAVIMPKKRHIEGIRDSKKLSAKKRKAYSIQIYKEAIAVGIGMRDAHIVDDINIKQATLLAMKDAVSSLVTQSGDSIVPQYILVDAEHIDVSIPQLSIIGGDDVCYPISCASIVAKVFRDEMMIKLSEQYPQYDWEKNKGYGTKAHREAILKYGTTPLHRQSFLKNLLGRKE